MRLRRRQRLPGQPTLVFRVFVRLKPFWPLVVVYSLLCLSAASIVVGVAAIYWPGALIVAGVLGILVCTVDLGGSRRGRRRPPGS